MENTDEWVFSGWVPASIVNGTIGEITFTAKWDTRQYNVTLNAGIGVLPDGT